MTLWASGDALDDAVGQWAKKISSHLAADEIAHVTWNGAEAENADAERMKLEATVLKENPLLIQKIIAEKLSDKVQIMMVPNDGKFFFANDVLKGMTSTSGIAH